VNAAALRGAFLDHLGSDLRARLAGLPDLDQRLAEIAAAAVERWPDLGLDAPGYMARLAAQLSGEPDPEAALRSLHAADLYLACACAAGDARAVACFEAALFPEVDAAVASLRAPPWLADEVKQMVGEKLLVAAPGVAPRILDYTGRGELRTWFRVIATRTLVSLLRKGNKEVGGDDAVLELRAASDDPHLAALKQRYKGEFKQAFEEAISGLTVRQRNLLRHQLVDGLTVDQIAAIYRVHRVTASRWLGQARKEVWLATRTLLSTRLGADTAELQSLLHDIRGTLDLSISRVLRGQAAGAEEVQ